MAELVPSPDDGALLESVGAAFSRLRRRTSLLDVNPPATPKDRSRELVINIVDEADEEITVGQIGEQLAVDPSVASRMVTDCIHAGFLERRASQHDGRRTVVVLTARGEQQRDQFRNQHRQAFVQITHDWPEHKRLAFARLLNDYVDACTALTRAGPGAASDRTLTGGHTARRSPSGDSERPESGGPTTT